MPVPDQCEKGHHGFMRKFEKNGQEWYSCTFKYQDGKTCWGKVPKDAPLYDEETNTSWRTPPKAGPTILGDVYKVAWEIMLTLNLVDDLRNLGARKVADSVRRMALFLQTGEYQGPDEAVTSMSREEK